MFFFCIDAILALLIVELSHPFLILELFLPDFGSFFLKFFPDYVFQVYVGTHMACKMDDRSTVELLFEVRRVSNELALI